MDSEIDRIRKAASGDENAFAELLRQYEPLIASQTRRFTQSAAQSDGEDAAQEARLAFFRAVCTYDSSQKDVTFGLYAKVCIHNALVSEVRRMHSRSRTVPHPHTESARSSSADDRREIASLRSRMVTILSPFERAVFDKYLSGLPARDIARVLGRPVKSVYNALFRIRAKIRAEHD